MIGIFVCLVHRYSPRAYLSTEHVFNKCFSELMNCPFKLSLPITLKIPNQATLGLLRFCSTPTLPQILDLQAEAKYSIM